MLRAETVSELFEIMDGVEEIIRDKHPTADQ